MSKVLILDIVKNSYETHDSYAYLGFEEPDLEGEFYSLRSASTEHINPNVNTQNAIFHMYLKLSHVEYKYERIIYTIWDVLGDLGGVADVVLTLLGFFMIPYSEIDFKAVAISRFYTYNYHPHIDDHDHHLSDSKNVSMDLEIEHDKKHKRIQVTNNDFWHLLAWKLFGCSFCFKSDMTWKRARKIFEVGEKYLEEDFDAEKFLRQMRELRAWFLHNGHIDLPLVDKIKAERNLDLDNFHDEDNLHEIERYLKE